jgi:CRISPR/Cas system-associated exonuclease Cas4 (RecB family)
MSEPAPRIAVETTRPHFSFSQLSMFLRCSMQYYFRYVLGLKERPGLNLARGSAGHEALELNAKSKILTKLDQPVEQILDNFSTAFDKELSVFEPTDFEPGDNPGHEKDATTEILRYYRLSTKNDGAGAIMPLAVELDFTVPLPATEAHHEELKPITGKIDIISKRRRIVVPNGRPIERTEVLDHKFPSRKPSNAEQLAELSDQLTMYDLVLTRAGTPTADVGFEHFIPQTKTIGPRVEVSYRPLAAMTPERRTSRHERLLYKLRQAARQIRAGIFQPVDDPKTCSWCGYRKMCQYSLAKDDYDALLIRGRHQ